MSGLSGDVDRMPDAESMQPDSIAAIVVAYRSATTIDECLDRLRAASAVTRIVVVDNASNDSSATQVAAQSDKDARVQLLRNATNAGFAQACNQAAERCSEPWLAFVNPDCMLETDTLSRLRAACASVERAGLVGADLVDGAGLRDPSARRRDPDLRRMLAGGGRRQSVAVARDEAISMQPVDAVSGALMLMPRALFESIGGFDSLYRLHAEDLDLCRRVREAGHGVFVANEVTALHLRGVSSRSRPWFVEWCKHRGMWRYFRKFEGRAAPALITAAAFILIVGHYAIAAPRAWLRSLASQPRMITRQR